MVATPTRAGAGGRREPQPPIPAQPPCSLDALVRRLRAPDLGGRLRAARAIKNDVIANRGRKAAYVRAGAVPAMVDALKEALAGGCGGGGGAGADAATSPGGAGDVPPHSTPARPADVAVQAAAAVGSFAYGFDDGASAVREAGGVDALLRALEDGDVRVAEAGVRSLRLIHQAGGGGGRGGCM